MKQPVSPQGGNRLLCFVLVCLLPEAFAEALDHGQPSENLKELFPEEYGEADSFEEEETEQA